MHPEMSLSIPAFVKLINCLRGVALILMVLIFYHAFQSVIFAKEHLDMTVIVDIAAGAIMTYSFFFIDNLLFGIVMFSLVIKGKLLRNMYNTTRENTAYFWLIIASLVASIIYGSLNVITFNDRVTKTYKFKENMLEAIYDYPKGNIKQNIDRIQQKYACCGLESYRDWMGRRRQSQDINEVVPFSCCTNQQQVHCLNQVELNKYNSSTFNNSEETFFQAGCFEKFNSIYVSAYIKLFACGFIIPILVSMYAVGNRIVQSGDSIPRVNYKYRCWIFGKSPTGVKKNVFSKKRFFAKHKDNNIDGIFADFGIDHHENGKKDKKGNKRGSNLDRDIIAGEDVINKLKETIARDNIN